MPLLPTVRAEFRHAGQDYYGPGARDFMSLVTSDNSASRFLIGTPLFRGWFGRVVYALMVKGRKLALRLLGRRIMGH